MVDFMTPGCRFYRNPAYCFRVALVTQIPESPPGEKLQKTREYESRCWGEQLAACFRLDLRSAGGDGSGWTRPGAGNPESCRNEAGCVPRCRPSLPCFAAKGRRGIPTSCVVKVGQFLRVCASAGIVLTGQPAVREAPSHERGNP